MASNTVSPFTYDFGIAIAQSTVNKVVKLTGATVTLASAFYALQQTGEKYVRSIKENTIRFGGVLNTIKQIEQAQNRIINGSMFFTVEDQLSAMNKLMASGLNVEKELTFINKAAHASGRSIEGFAGAISNAISGNMGALVDMGLLTERATRMFEKYPANTIMRQQAVINFLKTHKGLQNAIKNDFETIGDQMLRIKETWKSFLKGIVGTPSDPNSFYGQIVHSLKMVAVAFSSNAKDIKRYGYVIGQMLGWVIRNIGSFVVWLGRQTKKAIQSVWKVTDDFQNQTRSMLVWLEFWKLKVMDFFKSYSSEIKMILKLLIAYKAMKAVFVISSLAIASVIRYRKALLGLFALRGKYLAMMGPMIGNKFTRFLQSLAVFLPRSLRRVWVSVGKMIEGVLFGGTLKAALLRFSAFFTNAFSFLGKGALFLVNALRNLPGVLSAVIGVIRMGVSALAAMNPVGWIVLAIGLAVTLYMKFESVRTLVNNIFKGWLEYLKLLWNSVVWLYVQIRIGFIKAYRWLNEYIIKPISAFFSMVKTKISKMWDSFKDSTVGKWLQKWIIDPLTKLFKWIGGIWSGIVSFSTKIVDYLRSGSNAVAESANQAAKEYGFSAPTIVDKPSSPTPITPTAPNNPIATAAMPNTPAVSSEGAPMVLQQGAVQIIINNGEGLDESTIAQKVREVLTDMMRTNNKRGGTI